MKKFVLKHPVLNIILGVALIAFAVLGMFVFDWFSDTVNVVVGALIILYTVFRFNRTRAGYKNSNALMIIAVEAVVAITLAVLLIFNELSMSLVLGLVLYLRGFVYLLILQLLKLRRSFEAFLIYMVVLTLGAYIWFGGPNFGDLFEWILFALIAAYGVLLLVFGIDKVRK